MVLAVQFVPPDVKTFMPAHVYGFCILVKGDGMIIPGDVVRQMGIRTVVFPRQCAQVGSRLAVHCRGSTEHFSMRYRSGAAVPRAGIGQTAADALRI
jgi:hypothetical protein